jgi:hypothetical protein
MTYSFLSISGMCPLWLKASDFFEFLNVHNHSLQLSSIGNKDPFFVVG